MDDLLNGNLVINSFAQTKLVAATVVRITLYLTVTQFHPTSRVAARFVLEYQIARDPLTKFAFGKQREKARTRRGEMPLG